MSGATGAAAAAAYQMEIDRAIKASGSIVEVDPSVFLSLLKKNNDCLVVTARGNMFQKPYRYLTNYKGLTLFAQSSTELSLPKVETLAANKIWIPG